MDKEIIILKDLIITPLIKAKKSLENALLLEKTDITRDASIQRFEYTFELAWKTLKRILKYQGIYVNNPRDVFRESALQGIIDDPKQWFVFLEYRNQTTHVYNENVADEIYAALASFNDELSKVVAAITKL